MTDDIPPEITEVHELIQACGALLAGHNPHVIGAVVADLTATWAAGHLDLASKENTDRLRAELLEMHHDTIKRLIPINERLIRDHLKKAARRRRRDQVRRLMEPFKACRCGSTSFWKGPRGGASLNVTCTACGDRYNLLYHLGAPVMLIDILPPAELIDLSEEPHSAPTRSASQAPEET